MPAVTTVQGAAAMTDAVDQTMSQPTEVLVITVAIAMIMALLTAYNAAAINAKERTRETATMFAYGIRPGIVIRGNVLEALLIGALAMMLGVADGYAILRSIIDISNAQHDARPRHPSLDLRRHLRPRCPGRHLQRQRRPAIDAPATEAHRRSLGPPGR
jgi:hypothetical protein